MYTKVCSVCQVEKSIDSFEKRNGKPTYRCKDCLSQLISCSVFFINSVDFLN